MNTLVSLSDIVQAFKNFIYERTGIMPVYAPPHRVLAQKKNDNDVIISVFIVSQEERGVFRSPSGYVDNTKRDVRVSTFVNYLLTFQIDIIGKGRDTIKQVEETYRKMFIRIPSQQYENFGSGKLFSVLEVGGHSFHIWLDSTEDLTDLEPQEELRIPRRTITVSCDCVVAFEDSSVKTIITPDVSVNS
ncbi:hypothetical protein [Hydrogenobacter thermophilus]|uniref:hypothetical protein n=1 Tax=Hydrogenobacter thermophilus TaxID=940 RepID=UPI0030FA1BAA